MAVRERMCPTCRAVFSYEIARGRDRKHCSLRCRKAAAAVRLKAYVGTHRPKCSKGCGRKVYGRRGPCVVCRSHERRTGDKGPVARVQTGRHSSGHGYVVLTAMHGHPLSNRDGAVYEHRAVMYREWRGTVPACHWCGQQLSRWSAVVVDHLNENKADNSPGNLVPSCNSCNRARGAMLPFIKTLLPERYDELIACMFGGRCDAKPRAA
jgi:hypothetical protein